MLVRPTRDAEPLKFQGTIPAVLVQPNDGSAWGTKIGSCAGETFEISLTAKRVDQEACRDPARWVPAK